MALVKPLPAQIAKIKVVGVGGAGGNTVNFMSQDDQIRGVDFVAVNTDAQALLVSQAKIKVQIGEEITKGLGAGGLPDLGEQAAEESREKIKEVLEGADIVFVTCGLGGGTGSGAAPIISQIIKEEIGALTVAVVTKPFLFEGTKRMVVAEEAIERLKSSVDTLIVIPNQRLLESVDKNISLREAFAMVDSILAKGVQGIADLIVSPGLINLDFADIRSIMKDSGTALLGIGNGSGENKVEQAVMEAINSPLADISIEGARGVLFNITGGPDLTMAEVEKAAQIITKDVVGDANIIFGTVIDEKFDNQVRVTVIATGFDSSGRRALAGLVKPRSKQDLFGGVAGDLIGKEKKPKGEKKKDGQGEKKRQLGKNVFDSSDLPPGVEIDLSDELDIPTFLRKGA
jgi:cell division protein FtsZ